VYGWVEPPSQEASHTIVFKKISVYLFTKLNCEFSYCAFFSMNENDLYIVVDDLLVEFMFI
jgi:hypothetical protein